VTLHAIVIGNGLLGSAAVTEVLCAARFAQQVASLHVIDPAEVRELTLMTSPQYAGWLGQPKAEAVAAIARERLGDSARVVSYKAFVQAVDLRGLLADLEAGDDDLTVVVLTPDSWPSRIDAMWQTRLAGGVVRGRIVVVQMGVDRSLVQASVFGNGFAEPCVVCGLASSTLPASEPCVVLRPEGRLLRGTLRPEREAAIALFSEILDDLLTGRPTPLNRKTVLRVLGRSGAVQRFDHPVTRSADCWGPHDPRTAALSLNDLLLTDDTGGIRCKEPQPIL
jgi:hypothetical protein